MTSYPSSLVSFTTKTNKVDLVDASHINSMQNEIVAIETELGVLVKGTATDLKTRLAVCLAGNGAIVNSPSFPSSPVAWQLFGNQTDGRLYYRNNANTQFTAINQAISLISSTSFSAVTETSDITISTGKTYKVIVNLQQATSASVIKIIFNNDTAGSNYQYFYNQYAFEATPTQTKAGSSGTNDIVIVPSMNSSGRSFIEFYIATTYTSSQIRVVGTSTNESQAGPHVSTDFAGIYDGGTCSSFDISTTAGTFTGTVYLYELFTS